jgi:ketosteroid isomerase-like protein
MRIRSLVLLVAVAGCAQGGSSAADSAGAKDAIAAMDARYQKWAAAGQSDSIVAGYYTADATVLDPNSAAAVGSAAIKASLDDTFKAGNLKLSFHMTSFHVADSLAFDSGPYTLELRDKKDSTKVLMSDHGNFVTTFVKRNGEWRSIQDIAASEVAAAPAPPPAKKK